MYGAIATTCYHVQRGRKISIDRIQIVSYIHVLSNTGIQYNAYKRAEESLNLRPCSDPQRLKRKPSFSRAQNRDAGGVHVEIGQHRKVLDGTCMYGRCRKHVSAEKYVGWWTFEVWPKRSSGIKWMDSMRSHSLSRKGIWGAMIGM